MNSTHHYAYSDTDHSEDLSHLLHLSHALEAEYCGNEHDHANTDAEEVPVLCSRDHSIHDAYYSKELRLSVDVNDSVEEMRSDLIGAVTDLLWSHGDEQQDGRISHFEEDYPELLENMESLDATIIDYLSLDQRQELFDAVARVAFLIDEYAELYERVTVRV